MSNQPMLINLPPPPSDPVTPSDLPGTPNSTTTSMSELSTVAIKDGHRGHLPHHHHAHNPQTSGGLDAERADRISRLAGLERVAAVRQPTPVNLTPGATAPPPGYFDTGNPQYGRERSTVGSASATGSVGGRTTWASGSDVYDPDKMSEDMETSSTGMSEEGTASLVGFGEGARTPARREGSAYGNMSPSKTPVGQGQGGVLSKDVEDARMIDGVTYDEDVVDTVNRTPPAMDQDRVERASKDRVAGSD